MNQVRKEISDPVKKHLLGKTVLVTRPAEQAGEFVALLQSAGAGVIEFPAIRIIDPPSWIEYDRALQNIENFTVIVFTSANAVKYFMKRFPEGKIKILHLKKIFAVGTKTKEAINQFNLNAEVITQAFTGEALGLEMMNKIGRDDKVLFPRGNKGRFELLEVLRSSRFEVTDITVYQNTGPDEKDIEKFSMELAGKFIDVYTFFSPSSVRNLLNVLPEGIPDKAAVAVIGPTTATAAREIGLKVHIEAPRSTSEDLAEAIINYFGRRGNK